MNTDKKQYTRSLAQPVGFESLDLSLVRIASGMLGYIKATREQSGGDLFNTETGFLWTETIGNFIKILDKHSSDKIDPEELKELLLSAVINA